MSKEWLWQDWPGCDRKANSGIDLADKTECAFLRVYDKTFLRVWDKTAIRADRRLSMTATPKISAESVRTQTAEKAAVLVSAAAVWSCHLWLTH
ncbi:hypothetical protein GCM10007382_17690 [Salinibacterium xinjiangense]|uniref:hypothetical protein n=1 Tax=Salinibacterium xinjiangense TaxID=386302 RepID=UPI000BE480F7|nr:hypothetical protein [Salinibacterium xinjiangense]GGK97879.1 hypothetical protein GCM10007382_17690 [Salinibacterium xinjiangense]